MNNKHQHRWPVAAVVAALVMTLALPSLAAQGARGSAEAEFVSWWSEVVHFVTSVLGLEAAEAASETGPHMDPNGGNAVAPGPGVAGGNAGDLDGQ